MKTIKVISPIKVVFKGKDPVLLNDAIDEALLLACKTKQVVILETDSGTEYAVDYGRITELILKHHHIEPTICSHCHTEINEITCPDINCDFHDPSRY